MILAVVDTETTGLGDQDQVIELAIATIAHDGDRFWLQSAWSTLLRPTVPVTIGARSVHHVTDEDLARERSVTEMLLLRGLPEFGHPSEALLSGMRTTGLLEDVVLVAHSAEFDRRMLIQSGVHPALLPPRTICTWRCAQHLWPDAESHKNQSLRYELGLLPAFSSEEPPHRALADVAVTAALVAKMLETRSPEQLIEMTTTPALQKKISFGQNRGRLWSEMDVGFLRWILTRPTSHTLNEDVKRAARHQLAEKDREQRELIARGAETRRLAAQREDRS